MILEERWGSDLKVVNMARASLDKRETEMNSTNVERLKSLVLGKQSAPFEHSGMTVFVTAPIGVMYQWQRDRGQAFSELTNGDPNRTNTEFWVPEPDHVRSQVGKPGAYIFEPVSPEQAEFFRHMVTVINESTMEMYDQLIEDGFAKEIVRNILPLSMMTKMYATSTLGGWLSFLNLRDGPATTLEFRDEIDQVEAIIADEFPVTHEAWYDNRRIRAGL